MTAIDYAALATAAYIAWCHEDPDQTDWAVDAKVAGGEAKAGFDDVARAVVAALKDQGFAVVRAEDIEPLLLYVDDGHVLDRLTTATAPGDEETP